MNGPEFDQHAATYDEQIQRGLALSGERKEYFAERRLAWMRPLLERHGVKPRPNVLDYGCGIGAALPLLRDELEAACVFGADVSAASLAAARDLVGPDDRVQLLRVPEQQPCTLCDLAYTSGVFHHIVRAERPEALAYIWQALRPGGLLAFWEHNRWNPGTQLIVSRIPFDRDAVLLSAREARRLLRASGFEVLATHYLFVFPRALKALRGLEPALARWPLGAQYLVLARRNHGHVDGFGQAFSDGSPAQSTQPDKLRTRDRIAGAD